MEIEYRLEMFSLLCRAIKEFYLSEVRKRIHEITPVAYIDALNPKIFEPIDLDTFLDQFGKDKNTRLSILRILDKMLGELFSTYDVDYKKYLYSYVDNYFAQSEEYQIASEKIRNYFESEEGQRERAEKSARANKEPLESARKILQECYEDSFLTKLAIQFSYFPYQSNRHPYEMRLITPQQLKCANESEEDFIQDHGISGILNLRDYIFSIGFYPEDSYLDGTPFTRNEITVREFIKKTFLEEYLAQVLRADMDIRNFIQTLNNTIDDKWEILLSKYKRGVYCDEYGVTHKEEWQKDLRYFALNVAADSSDVPEFLVYLRLDFDHLAYKLKMFSTKIDQIILSLIIKEHDIREIIKLNATSLKRLKDDSVVQLCSFLFDYKLNYEGNLINDSDINRTTPEVINDSSQNTLNTSTSETGRIFEFWTKEQLEKSGFEISMTPITGDQGVDIIATRDGKRYAIQCKSYTGQVGNAAVQEVIAGRIFYDCDYACVVTDSSFTPSAYQLAAKAGVIMCANENLDPLK